MRKKTQLFLLLILCITISSCNNNEKSHGFEMRFEKIKSLDYESFDVKNDEFYSKIYKLLIYNNQIIAYDYNNEYFFSKTNIQNNTLNRFGKLGQGPNEIVMMPSTLTVFDNNFYFYSSTQNSLFSVNIEQGGSYIPEKVVDFDPAEKIISVIPVAYKNYIALGGFMNGRYLLLDQAGKSISSFYDYPEFDYSREITNLHKALAFQGHLMRRPDGKRFFFAGRDSEIIEILEVKENNKIVKIFDFQGKIASFNFDGDGVNYTASSINKKSKIFFVDANCTQKYIYLLYATKVIGDNLSNALESSKVFVLDWNGNPMYSLHLNIDVSYIAIDENDEIIYAYNSKNEELVTFKINSN